MKYKGKISDDYDLVTKKYVDTAIPTYDEATTSTAGLMSASDKTKLDGVDTGANKTVVDTALSSTSTNPVQNKVINTALSNKADSAIDNLTSTSTTNALSANQGKVLNDKFTITKYSNISVSVTPTALSSYQAWDTSKAYGYSADITMSGITANSLIQNIVMTDTLLSAIASVVTTGSNKLTVYTSTADTLTGTIISLYTQEVENG